MAPIPGIACMGAVGGATGRPLYVGGLRATGVGNAAVTVTLTGALSGGLGSSPIVDDVVIVCAAQYAPGDVNLDVTGFTELCDIYSNNTFDINLAVAWKRMTATPDASFQVTSSLYSASGRPFAIVAHVWRRTNATTPIDVTTQTATGTGNSSANPPSITPVTGGSVILAVGAGAQGADGLFSASQLSNFIEENNFDSFNAMVGVGSYNWQGGAFDPNAFTVSAGSDSLSSWAAATLALRP